MSMGENAAPVHGNREVKVEIVRPRRMHDPTVESERRGAKVGSRSTDYVYVNSAYVGSLNNVAGSASQNSVNRIPEPPTSVYREQYWACSKWPFAQKMLALAVGVLVGAVIGLSVTYAMNNKEDMIGGIFSGIEPNADDKRKFERM